ncbi:hypothetical protein [Fontivita pretiosa]|uniref:hypothetical protein n=1 Tax=Fontivita pretiosa TaxID=2989684 RepID=UPI003D1836C0
MRSAPLPESDLVLNYLTTQQHLQPHQPVGQVLEQTVQALGCCPQAVERARQWLAVDGARAIGRLRRSELVQLARVVHRFWMHNLGNSESSNQPSPSPAPLPPVAH